MATKIMHNEPFFFLQPYLSELNIGGIKIVHAIYPEEALLIQFLFAFSGSELCVFIFN